MLVTGFRGERPGPVFERFMAMGLGGVIFFRDNFQHFSEPQQAADLIEAIAKTAGNASAAQVEHLALERDGLAEDVIEGRDAVGRDEDHPPVVGGVRVADFATIFFSQVREIGIAEAVGQLGADERFHVRGAFS